MTWWKSGSQIEGTKSIALLPDKQHQLIRFRAILFASRVETFEVFQFHHDGPMSKTLAITKVKFITCETICKFAGRIM